MTFTKSTPTAIIGVSHDPTKYGSRIFRDLLKNDYSVFGVNPKGGEVDGVQLSTSLAGLPVKPELVITVVPPVITEKIVDDCTNFGVKTIWMQPGSESEKAIQKAKEQGIEVVSGACYMKKQGVW